MILIILTILVLLSIVACHFIAKNRGLNPVFWGVMGGIFGPFAIPFVLIVKSKKKQHDNCE